LFLLLLKLNYECILVLSDILQKFAPDRSGCFEKPEHCSSLGLSFALQKLVLGVEKRVSQERVRQIMRLFQVNTFVLFNLKSKKK
jgi:hypothetical protein